MVTGYNLHVVRHPQMVTVIVGADQASFVQVSCNQPTRKQSKITNYKYLLHWRLSYIYYKELS